MNMANREQRSWRYPNIIVTVKNETDERSVTEISSKSQRNLSKNNHHTSYYHPTTVYYNSNYRYQQQKQRFHSTSSSNPQRRSKNLDYFYHQKSQEAVRPLMDIQDSPIPFYNDFNHKNTNAYSNSNVREPKQRGKYRNRRAELDWDHGFDLDQTALYTTSNDIDNHSLSSMNSSGNNSLSSV